jgi:glycerol-3-phosphate dehydrogenase (NAD(P)+)
MYEKIKSRLSMQLGIYGAGAFGTALAVSFFRANFSLRWLCYDEEEAKKLNHKRSNPLSINLPEGLMISSSHNFEGLDALMWVVPSQVVKSSFEHAKPYLSPSLPIVLCSKGMINHCFLHDVVKKIIPNPLLVMGGPNLALEVAQGLPAEAVLACDNFLVAKNTSDFLYHKQFSLYPSVDVIGVELCGVLKNVYAIGAGMILGREMGANMHAAFFAKALNEMIIIGEKFKAKKETFLGLAGLGDLVLTGSQLHSRNMSFGMALGRGEKAEDILKNRTMVTEGVQAAKNIFPLIQDCSVPILKDICTMLLHV